MPFDTFRDLMGAVRGGVVIYDNVRVDLAGPISDAAISAANGKTPSAPGLNRGGWKSSERFLDDVAPARALRQALESEYLAGGRSVGWAMVNRFGSEHKRHQHRMVPLAGVYYATTGDPIVPTIFEMAGCVPDVDPSELPAGVRCRQVRMGVSVKSWYEMEIDPIVGRVVLMCGDVWHRVPKYDSDVPRVTIAFDVRPPR